MGFSGLILKKFPSLTRIVTGDEKWVLYNNNKFTRQWLSSNQVAVAILNHHSV